MSEDQSTSHRGKLQFGSAPTVDMRGPKPRPRHVQLEKDPALGLLSLEDRFNDQGEIARGGMGAIHQVMERTLNRTVAMKVLPADRAGETRLRNRFLTEAQVTGQLEHPNIVPVYELGADDAGRLFFTMRLIEGMTLSQHLHEHPADSDEGMEQALEIFFRVCDALAFAHSRGVIHRDVKPANIMVGEFGQVYLMDWGIARVLSGAEAANDSGGPARRTTTLTIPVVDERGLVLGTYFYMPPEQAKGRVEAIDQRTDVFGMGAVLFRIAVGRPPIDGDTAAEALQNAMECNLALPDEKEIPGTLHRALLDVSMQAMQKNPEHRFQSVAGLKRAAQQVLRGQFRFPVRRYRAGERIIEEGAEGDDAYYIRSGSCRVFAVRDGVEVEYKTLSSGEVFGETAIFTGQPRNASVSAVTDAELIVVPGSFLAGTMGLDSWTGAFVRSLGERFTEGNRRVAELEVERGQAKFLSAIFRLLALEGDRSEDGLRMEFARLRRALADRWKPGEETLLTLLDAAGLLVEGEGPDRWVVLTSRPA